LCIRGADHLQAWCRSSTPTFTARAASSFLLRTYLLRATGGWRGFFGGALLDGSGDKRLRAAADGIRTFL
jgi:hypothetical protein